MKRSLLHPTTWLMFICALLFTACAQLGLQAPQSFEDRVQYTKAGIGAAYRTVGDNVAAKMLSSDKGAKVFGELDGLEKKVALAEELQKGGRPVDALSTITVAMNALVVIRNELAKKGTP